MTSKVKNTIIILLIIIGISAVGILYALVIQKSSLNAKQKKLKELKLFQMDTEALENQLLTYKTRVAQLDSVLANR